MVRSDLVYVVAYLGRKRVSQAPALTSMDLEICGGRAVVTELIFPRKWRVHNDAVEI